MLKYQKIKGNLVHKSAVINWNKINMSILFYILDFYYDNISNIL